MSAGVDPRGVRQSERVYAALIAVAYPGSFRARYAHEMRLAWRQLCQDAYHRGGWLGLAHAWVAELPALVAGGIRKRGAMLARPVAAAGAAGGFRAVLATNATALIVFGGALFVAATDLVLAYGLVQPSQVPAPNAPAEAWSVLLPVKLMAQVLGVVLIGVGGLALAVRTTVRTRIGVGVPSALAAAHTLVALAFLVSLRQFPSVLGWVTVTVSGAFGLVYAMFWLVEMSRADVGPRQPARGVDASG